MPERRPGLKVIKRDGTASLYLRGTVQGRRIFESAGTDDPKLAEERRKVREAEIYRGAILGVPDRVTFATAVVSYGQAVQPGDGTRARVTRILKALDDATMCDEITQASIDTLAQKLCRPGSAPATRHREVVTPITAILSHAARRGWCKPPMFESVQATNKRTEWVTPAEAEALVAGAGKHLQPKLEFLLCTGARVNEMVLLEWPSVDLRYNRATLRETKNGDDRIVDLPPRAVAALTSIAHRTGRVFLDRHGAPYRDTNDSKTTPYGGQISKAFATALSTAKIGRHLTPHVLRHTWATWHYCCYRDLLRLRDDGNWRSSSQVERYTKLAPAGLAPEIMKFWGLSGANPVHLAAEMAVVV